jgi:hypothetical protein
VLLSRGGAGSSSRRSTCGGSRPTAGSIVVLYIDNYILYSYLYIVLLLIVCNDALSVVIISNDHEQNISALHEVFAKPVAIDNTFESSNLAVWLVLQASILYYSNSNRAVGAIEPIL